MLHFPHHPPPSRVLMKPRRSDSLRGTGSGTGQGQEVLAGLAEELHDIKRVRDFGQEDDLKLGLGKMIERVEELSSLLAQAYKAQTELETQAKLAKSNLQMALANNEMLEDALRRESAAGSKNVGWRRRQDSQATDAPPPSDGVDCGSRPPSRHGSASNSVQSTPTSEAMMATSPPTSPVVRPAPSPQPQESGRFFRFRFGTSSVSTSPNPGASAGPSSRPQTPPVSGGSVVTSAGSAPRRPLDSVRERDASHLTSASLPSLVADNTKREHELEAALEAERAKYEKVNTEKQTLEAEVEGLSQALFEEANKMVAQERIKCAEIEEELKMVRAEKEALKSAMQIIEQENERLKSPPLNHSPKEGEPRTTQALIASPQTEEDANPTPRGSRPATPRSKHSKKPSKSTPRSSLSSLPNDIREIRPQSPSSSTRAIRERSASPSPESSIRSPSPSRAVSVIAGDTLDDADPKPLTPTSTKDQKAQGLPAWPSSGGSALPKSPFNDMPAPESPWSKI